MSGKSSKVQALLAGLDSRGLDPRYAGFFVCFDRGQYFEAHEVLEDLWLTDRRGPDGDFFKGLIQLAGAFVHLQKNRLRPATALLSLAIGNLEKYPSPHHQLDAGGVAELAKTWRQDLIASEGTMNPFSGQCAPRLDPFLTTATIQAAKSAAESLPDGTHRDDRNSK